MIEAMWAECAVPPRRSLPVAAGPVGFEVRGRSFLYDPNDMRLFRCDEAARQATLRQAERFRTAKPQFELPPLRPRMIVFVLTHQCNLRCRYCFHDQRRTPESAFAPEPAAMELETAEAALALLPPGTDFTVGFFGGEPLLYPGRLRELAERAETAARHRGVRARFSLTTNGTLLDAETAEFLDAHGFGLIVSLDGPALLHDASRPRADGAGSHAEVLRGLAAVGAHPRLAARTTLRATYTGGTAHLLERLRHLNAVADEHGLGNVSVEPADLTEGCARGGAEPVGIDAALEEEYYDAAAWFVERLREGERARFHHLAVRLERLLRRTPYASECGAGCGYLAVNPRGELFACHREGPTAIGRAAGGIDTEAQAPWRDNRYYAREECPACWLRNVCGGGCRYNSLLRHGRIDKPDPLGCRLTEVCVKAAAWALSEMTEAERLAWLGASRTAGVKDAD